MGTAREVTSKHANPLVMIIEKKEGLINSVRDVHHGRTDQTSSRKQDNNSHMNRNSGGGQSAFKNVITASSNEGSAARSATNQQHSHLQNQLSNSLQMDGGARRMGGPKSKENQLSGSAESVNRYV